MDQGLVSSVGLSLSHQKLNANDCICHNKEDDSQIDSDIAGTGLKVVSIDVSGFTLTAAAYDAIDNDAEISKDKTGNTEYDKFRHIKYKAKSPDIDGPLLSTWQ